MKLMRLGIIGFAFAASLTLPFVNLAFAQVAHTARQLEHSKLYASRGMKGRKLTSGGLAVFQETPLQPTLKPRSEALHDMACRADAVVLGTVVRESSFLVPDETFVFTDADVSVSEVVKNNDKSPIYSNQTITVTRPGGTAYLNGREVNVRLNHFQPFVGGRRYLLFLTFLPKTEDYEAFGDKAFLIGASDVHNMSGLASWDESSPQSKNIVAVLQDVRSVANSTCK